jgi:hypothetical protein
LLLAPQPLSAPGSGALGRRREDLVARASSPHFFGEPTFKGDEPTFIVGEPTFNGDEPTFNGDAQA